MTTPAERGGRARRVLLSVLYWAAVLAISLAILVGLVLLLESRDDSDIDEGAGAGTRAATPARL